MEQEQPKIIDANSIITQDNKLYHEFVECISSALDARDPYTGDHSRISAIILHHHERYDGKGYPFGAKADEIPIGARIIAVCDSIDAMASARAYRKALPLDIVRNEIEKNIGLMYDPAVAKKMLDNWSIIKEMYGHGELCGECHFCHDNGEEI